MSVEEVLIKRIKLIGENDHTYTGTPNDLIEELEAYILKRNLAELRTLLDNQHTTVPLVEGEEEGSYVISLDITNRIAELEALVDAKDVGTK